MTWDTEFDELLSQEVTRVAYTGQDGYGQPAFGAATKIRCRIVYKPVILRGRGGGEATGVIREVVASATVYCSGVVGWNLRDKITLPDGSQPPILEVRNYPDEDGSHHEMVLL